MAEQKSFYETLGVNDPDYRPLQQRVEKKLRDMLQNDGGCSQRVAQTAAHLLCHSLSLEKLRDIEAKGLAEEDNKKLTNLVEQYRDEERMWGLEQPSI